MEATKTTSFMLDSLDAEKKSSGLIEGDPIHQFEVAIEHAYC